MERIMSNNITFFWENNPTHMSYKVYTSNERFSSDDLSNTDVLNVDTDQNSVSLTGEYGSVLYAMLEVVDSKGVSVFSELQKVQFVEGIVGSLSKEIYIINSNLDKIVNTASIDKGTVHDMDVHHNVVYVATLGGSLEKTAKVYAIDANEVSENPIIWEKEIDTFQAPAGSTHINLHVFDEKIFITLRDSLYSLSIDGETLTHKLKMDDNVGEYGLGNNIISMDIGKSGKFYVISRRSQGDMIYVLEDHGSGQIIANKKIELNAENHPMPHNVAVSDSEEIIYFSLNLKETVEGFRDTHTLNMYNIASEEFTGLGDKNAVIKNKGFEVKGRHRYTLQMLINEIPSTSIKNIQVLELDTETSQVSVKNIPDIKVPDIEATEITHNEETDKIHISVKEDNDPESEEIVIEIDNPMPGIEIEKMTSKYGMLIINYSGTLNGKKVHAIRVPIVEYLPEDISYSMRSSITSPLDIAVRGDGSIALSNENVNTLAPYSFTDNKFHINYKERNNTPLMDKMRPLIGKHPLKFRF